VAVGVAAVGAFAGLLVGSAIIFFFGLVLVAVVGTHIYALTLVLGPLITGATTMAAALAVAWQPRTSRTSTVTCLGIASGIGTLLYLLPGGTGDLRSRARARAAVDQSPNSILIEPRTTLRWCRYRASGEALAGQAGGSGPSVASPVTPSRWRREARVGHGPRCEMMLAEGPPSHHAGRADPGRSSRDRAEAPRPALCRPERMPIIAECSVSLLQQRPVLVQSRMSSSALCSWSADVSES